VGQASGQKLTKDMEQIKLEPIIRHAVNICRGRVNHELEESERNFLWSNLDLLYRELSVGTQKKKPTNSMTTLVGMRSSLFWDVTQPRVVIMYRRFGTTYRSHLVDH
jgi:hypothetical protein